MRASRSRSIVAIAVLSSCTLLAVGSRLDAARQEVRNGLAPVRRVGATLTKPIGGLYAKVADRRDLKQENARLRAELDAAKAASLRYGDAVRERRELLKLNGFEDPDGMSSVPARVIGGSLSNFDELIEIDRGTDAGVRVHAAVVTGAGLVGQVVSVSSASALIMVVTDPSSSVGVRLSISGDAGVARGQHRGELLDIGLIDLDTKVGKNEVLVTSGLDGSRFPAGIPVARVRSSRRGAVQNEVMARPVVDLQHLSFVRVLVRKPS